MSDDTPETEVSRRDFLKKAAAGGVAAAVLDMPREASAAPANWDRSADVIIVGAGSSAASECHGNACSS